MFPKGYSPLSDYGEGAIAKVVKSIEERTGDVVAIKVLKDFKDQDDVARLAVEMESISRVRHPNIVSFLNHGKCKNGAPYVVMEWLEGITLRDLLEEEEILDEQRISEIVIQILDAIVACHKKGIIHRDLKPENIMLTGQDHKTVKLIDFGMAKILFDGRDLTMDGELFGTPQYLSPERITGDQPNPQSDIYSIGIMVFEMATGIRPFDGDNANEIIMLHLTQTGDTIKDALRGFSVSSRLKQLIYRMLRKVPEQRPSALGLRDNLRAFRQNILREKTNPRYNIFEDD